jgi:hypothetical protein
VAKEEDGHGSSEGSNVNQYTLLSLCSLHPTYLAG